MELRVSNLKEVLDIRHYGVTEKVAIYESKETLHKSSGLNETIINLYELDARNLTILGKSEQNNYFIVVYDYEDFKRDNDYYNAAIYHELGHIQYPSIEVNLDTEIFCDNLAIEAGQIKGLRKVLDSMLEFANSLKNELLIELTNKRIENLERMEKESEY